ncbi:hypothetical protein [Streptomyces sp. NPDC018584]|uniref:hypothetical protein n=1 Tax=unclassified Streptomyces TaxID=2593676 RepID=UPI0037B89F64
MRLATAAGALLALAASILTAPSPALAADDGAGSRAEARNGARAVPGFHVVGGRLRPARTSSCAA